MQHPSPRRLLIGTGGGSTIDRYGKTKSSLSRCTMLSFDDRNKQYRVRIITNDGVMGVELTP